MPGTRPINIQDSFLFQSLKESRPLDVPLVTGKAFKGVTIKRFDRFALVLVAGTQEVLVYKYAIAVIADVEGAAPRANGRPPSAVRRTPVRGPRNFRPAHSRWAGT